MQFGPLGLRPDRFPEVVTVIQNEQIANIEDKFSYESNNKIFQLNSIYARSADQLAQLIESAFDQLKLNSAEKFHLDEIALLRGVYRIAASPSFTISQYALLNTGSVIPVGTQFSANQINVKALNPSAVTGSTTACSEATSQTNEAVVGATYGFSINGDAYQHVVLPTQTVEDVHNALIVLFDANTAKTFTYTEQLAGGGRSFIFTANTGTTLAISSLSIKMVIQTVKVYFRLDVVGAGPTEVGAGLMSSTVISVPGLLGTSNDADFTLGRAQELDSALRLRVGEGNVSDCTGTPDTIRNAMLTNVAGVSTASVAQNLNMDPFDADGRPFMSYEVLVVGGTNADVAAEVWRTAGAAARTHGNVTEATLDSAGLTQFVQFSRPAEVSINVNIDYELYTEETLPSGAVAAIQAAVVEFISARPIGKDVIAGRLFDIVYSTVQGLGKVVITVERVVGGSGFTDNKIAIGGSEYATTTLAAVVLNQV